MAPFNPVETAIYEMKKIKVAHYPSVQLLQENQVTKAKVEVRSHPVNDAPISMQAGPSNPIKC